MVLVPTAISPGPAGALPSRTASHIGPVSPRGPSPPTWRIVRVGTAQVDLAAVHRLDAGDTRIGRQLLADVALFGRVGVDEDVPWLPVAFGVTGEADEAGADRQRPGDDGGRRGEHGERRHDREPGPAATTGEGEVGADRRDRAQPERAAATRAIGDGRPSPSFSAGRTQRRTTTTALTHTATRAAARPAASTGQSTRTPWTGSARRARPSGRSGEASDGDEQPEQRTDDQTGSDGEEAGAAPVCGGQADRRKHVGVLAHVVRGAWRPPGRWPAARRGRRSPRR